MTGGGDRFGPAARLSALLDAQVDHDRNRDPLEEVRADLAVYGIDPNPTLSLAKTLASRNMTPAGVLYDALADLDDGAAPTTIAKEESLPLTELVKALAAASGSTVSPPETSEGFASSAEQPEQSTIATVVAFDRERPHPRLSQEPQPAPPSRQARGRLRWGVLGTLAASLLVVALVDPLPQLQQVGEVATAERSVGDRSYPVEAEAMDEIEAPPAALVPAPRLAPAPAPAPIPAPAPGSMSTVEPSSTPPRTLAPSDAGGGLTTREETVQLSSGLPDPASPAHPAATLSAVPTASNDLMTQPDALLEEAMADQASVAPINAPESALGSPNLQPDPPSDDSAAGITGWFPINTENGAPGIDLADLFQSLAPGTDQDGDLSSLEAIAWDRTGEDRRVAIFTVHPPWRGSMAFALVTNPTLAEAALAEEMGLSGASSEDRFGAIPLDLSDRFHSNAPP